VKTFRFKHFSLEHRAAAHKIGTDGILLGAWAQLAPTAHILDLGSGCGLIGLMLLQRYPQATLTAVERHRPSWEESVQNIQNSPFAARGRMLLADYKEIELPQVDAVVCNPPYFEESPLPSRSEARKIARQQGSLSALVLLERSTTLLKPDGSLQLVAPASQQSALEQAAQNAGLHLHRKAFISSVSGKKPERLLLHWAFRPSGMCQEEQGDLRTPEGDYTRYYRRLTRDFHPFFH